MTPVTNVKVDTAKEAPCLTRVRLALMSIALRVNMVTVRFVAQDTSRSTEHVLLVETTVVGVLSVQRMNLAASGVTLDLA